MPNSLIIGIAGRIRSGKSTVARYLNEKYNAHHFENSLVLKMILESLGVDPTRENMYLVAKPLLSELGNDIIARARINEASKSQYPAYVVTGIRYPEEINLYKDCPRFKLIYIECDNLTRSSRITGSEGKVKDGTNISMEKIDLSPSERYQLELGNFADYTLDNNGSLEEVFVSVDRIMAEMNVDLA
jgi:dephospho-CoA kinase